MVTEPWSSDPVDPLSAYSGLSIFPRTFGVAPDPSNPYNPDAGIDTIHNHLKSVAAVSLEPILDVDQLKDPLEFFLAYERLENATRELQKQIGNVSTDLNQYNPSTTTSAGDSREIINVSLNEQIKEKLRRPRECKRKELSRRQSLAGASLFWKSGVRRSTRIRTRPLEYWKGERLLYGRIHESLATVIGLKYASPTKDGEKPTLKVKSYVSDEYKELVELAALH